MTTNTRTTAAPASTLPTDTIITADHDMLVRVRRAPILDALVISLRYRAPHDALRMEIELSPADADALAGALLAQTEALRAEVSA